MSTSTYSLANKLLNFLNLTEKLQSAGVVTEAALFRPFITIAREPGSGGAPIAAAVAKKLGYELIDEQLIDEVARSTKKRRAIVENMDEKERSQIDALVESFFSAEHLNKERYLFELIKAILTYAYQGKTVILGRGANFITPFGKGLHVNITAPYSLRVKRAMDFEGHSEKRAKEVIATVEKERLDFVKNYFSADAAKMNAYDLTINTSYFKINEARDLVITAFQKKFSETLKPRIAHL